MACWVDAGLVRVTIQILLDQQITAREIEQAANLSPSDVTVIMRGTTGKPRPKRILAEKAERIFALEARRDHLAAAGPNAFRFRRRLFALARRGWRLVTVADGSGVGCATVADIMRGTERKLSTAVAGLLDEFYQAHKFELGDSLTAHDRAELKQYPPAEAWPDSSIDDPKSQPDWSLVDAGAIRRELTVHVEQLHLASLRDGSLTAKRVRVGPVVRHIELLLDQGMPMGAIARGAKRPYTRVFGILYKAKNRGLKWVNAADAAAIIAVGFDPLAVDKGVRALGARRRIQALQWNKWRLREIAAGAGVGYVTVAKISSGQYEWVRTRTFEAVMAFYADNSDCEGGAKRRGRFPPPMAWDDETIDDPEAVPNGWVKPERKRRQRK